MQMLMRNNSKLIRLGLEGSATVNHDWAVKPKTSFDVKQPVGSYILDLRQEQQRLTASAILQFLRDAAQRMAEQIPSLSVQPSATAPAVTWYV